MKTLAIISEFNPFHNGHKYLLDKSKEITKADLALTIMSGDFVQRGEPAIIDKFRRAQAAIYAGFDLVLEMPNFVSLQAANFFAKKNIELLNKIGVDFLCFGIENISAKDFKELINYILNHQENIEQNLKKYLKQGYSYTKSSYLSVGDILEDKKVLTSNNILAFEYIKAIKQLKADIKFVPIERVLSKNSDREINNETYASSTAIRKNLCRKNMQNLLPKASYYYLNNFYNTYMTYPKLNDFYNLLRYKLLIEKTEMTDILCFEDGMDNLFYKNIKTCNSFDEFVNKSTATRFTSSRIRRLSLNYLLENKKSFNQFDIDFVRVLCCKKSAMKFLASRPIKKVISKKDLKNLKDYEKIALESNIKASNLYNMNIGRPIDFDFTRKFILQ
ncbi:MAG: nucleotidyltransferase family protein [Peptoniphilaceae bacterium]|nr:nucleotidyltransferase family protein [Peptoniphilaceae bacterium]MDY6019397.1 nucleotidyltransferase family protein [Anaerococcus sp.]